MSKARSRRIVTLSALLAGLLIVGVTPAFAAPMKLSFGSCRDIRNSIPGARDGNYILFVNNTVLTVYCADMAGTPREYISLARTGPNSNFSQYTAGGASPGTNVRTTYTRLRIDPATLTVDIGDTTYASSAGSLTHSNSGQTVTSMPYSVAMSCTAASVAKGVGNIDLRDTPFKVDNAFSIAGFKATGSARPSSGGQLVDLAGGGYCGWISPAPPMYNPFNPRSGDYHLKLACAGFVRLRNQVCFKII